MLFQSTKSWVKCYTDKDSEYMALQDLSLTPLQTSPPFTFPLLTFLQRLCPFLFFLDTSSLFQSMGFMLAVSCVETTLTLDLHRAVLPHFHLLFQLSLLQRSFLWLASLEEQQLLFPLPSFLPSSPPSASLSCITFLPSLMHFVCLFVFFLLSVICIRF